MDRFWNIDLLFGAKRRLMPSSLGGHENYQNLAYGVAIPAQKIETFC